MASKYIEEHLSKIPKKDMGHHDEAMYLVRDAVRGAVAIYKDVISDKEPVPPNGAVLALAEMIVDVEVAFEKISNDRNIAEQRMQGEEDEEEEPGPEEDGQ